MPREPLPLRPRDPRLEELTSTEETPTTKDSRLTSKVPTPMPSSSSLTKLRLVTTFPEKPTRRTNELRFVSNHVVFEVGYLLAGVATQKKTTVIIDL